MGGRRPLSSTSGISSRLSRRRNSSSRMTRARPRVTPLQKKPLRKKCFHQLPWEGRRRGRRNGLTAARVRGVEGESGGGVRVFLRLLRPRLRLRLRLHSRYIFLHRRRRLDIWQAASTPSYVFLFLVSPKCILISFSCKINVILRNLISNRRRDGQRTTSDRLSAREIREEDQQPKQFQKGNITKSFKKLKHKKKDQVDLDRAGSSENMWINETRLGENKYKAKQHRQQKQQTHHRRRVPKRLWTDCEHLYKSFNSERNKFVLP